MDLMSMTKPILRKPEEGEVWNVLGEKIICKVSSKDTFGRFAVVEETSPPKSAVPPHFHNQTDEIVYVLEGRYEFEIDGKTQIAEKGDTLVIPRNTPHGFRNPLTSPSKMLAIITPSGFENFFAEISQLAEPAPDEIVETGKRNDLELVIDK
jgi:quercetin dioxygenase-like cupin family protein